MADCVSGQTGAGDQVSGRKENVCGPCKNKSMRRAATVFCNTCSQYQCDECVSVHNKFTYMSGHDIDRSLSQIRGGLASTGDDDATDDVASGSAEAVASIYLGSDSDATVHVDAPMDMTGLDICEEHKKLYELYCKGHDKLCCSLCAIHQHKDCSAELKAIDTYVREINFEPSDLLVELMTANSNAAALLQQYKANRENIDKNCKEVERLVKHIQNVTINHINNMQSEVMAEAFKEKAKYLNELDEKLAKCESMLQELDELQKAFANIMDTGSVEMIFIAFHKITARIDEMSEQCDQINSEMFDVDVCLQFNDSICDLIHTESDLLTIKFDRSTFSGPPLPVIRPVLQNKVLFHTVTKIDGDKNVPSYIAMDFLDEKRIIAADSANNMCCLMNDSFTILNRLKLEFLPQGLCVLSPTEFVVSGHASGVFSTTKYFAEMKIGANNSIELKKTNVIQDNLASMATINVATVLACVPGDRRVARMVDVATATVSDTKHKLNDKKYDASKFSIAYIRNRDIVALSDKEEHAVYFFDMNKASADPVCFKDNAIRDPTGLCVGTNDCIYVCSSLEMLLQISPTAHAICYYPLGIVPAVVAFSKGGNMAVFGEKDGERSLQMWTMT